MPVWKVDVEIEAKRVRTVMLNPWGFAMRAAIMAEPTLPPP